MIEIKYEKGNFRLFHDNRFYHEKDLEMHLSTNGHPKEIIGFAVPFDMYKECKKISEDINSFLEKNRMLCRRGR